MHHNDTVIILCTLKVTIIIFDNAPILVSKLMAPKTNAMPYNMPHTGGNKAREMATNGLEQTISIYSIQSMTCPVIVSFTSIVKHFTPVAPVLGGMLLFRVKGSY